MIDEFPYVKHCKFQEEKKLKEIPLQKQISHIMALQMTNMNMTATQEL